MSILTLVLPLALAWLPPGCSGGGSSGGGAKPPAITSSPTVFGTEDEAYSYDVEASDPNSGDVLTFALTASPPGMTIGSSSGEINWSPGAGHVGVHTVTIEVTDSTDRTAAQTFALTVDPMFVVTPSTTDPVDPLTGETVAITGGLAPYEAVLSVNGSGGSVLVSGSTVNYTSGAISASDEVEITDARGRLDTVTFDVLFDAFAEFRERYGTTDTPRMVEAERARIDKVIVISGSAAASQEVDGTYGRSTPGLAGGMDAGSRMGTITREIGGVPIFIPIPGTALPGAILGGIAGVTQREIQEFRDELTEDLVESDSPALRSDGLALDAFWETRRLEHIESHLFSTSVEIPEDADALLYTSFDELSIDVQGKDAIITTSVKARVFLPDQGRDVYETVLRYQDRDTLGNWTANDRALWRSYTNFARHYLGKEIAADVFGRVALERRLVPAESPDTAFERGSKRRLTTDAVAPTLAWDLDILEAGAYPWAEGLDPQRIRYDIEVFDHRQLVYDAQGVAGASHALGYPLEPCRTYHWSVRPVYETGHGTRFGNWMRFADEGGKPSAKKKKKSKKQAKKEAAEARARAAFGKGLIGRQASTAPAYTQDFAALTVACSR